MPFGRKARNVRAYEYGCGQPISGEQEAIEQMRGRVRLWNQLVALDRQYEPQREAIVDVHISVPNDDEHRKEHRIERKAAFKREDVREQLRTLDKQEYEDARVLWLAAASSGIYWGNHEEVKVAWQQARRKPGELRFHAWRDEIGKVSVRWQNGLPAAEGFRDDTLLSLRHIPDPPPRGPFLPKQPRQDYYELSIRVGSEKRKPVWLVLPCYLHRPLPPDGLIRSASVLRERVGTKYRWKLVMIVETPEQQAVSRSGSTATIDLGWRRRFDEHGCPNGLRTAYWSGTDGRGGEVLLEERWLGGMAKVDDKRGERDEAFNVVRLVLLSWLRKHESLPDWMRERTKTLPQWRSCARLAALALYWRAHRFEGDEIAYEQLEAWRRHDKHHYEQEANLRDRLLRQRRHIYRCFAADLVRHYGKVVLEKFDLRDVAKRKRNGGQADEMTPVARHQRVLAAPSILRLAIKNACEREGVIVEEIDAAYSTLLCSECGSLERFNKAAELVHRCTACGAEWDQDWNATRVLSQRAGVLVQV